ncbi:asparaginase [Actinocrispum wychmicini]|uniref:L-asparaginase n=1 Tax=Actinocrispum wychmicini TaxID=1213861 RepID=A0A4R2IY58_9PSEU|nr:asparaginase domain-containing protein [Actinocrispum wychmicini]TCO48819.1 L-asparaginase [Actinocrispum wychmicini]
MRRVLLLATGDTIAYRPGSSSVASAAELAAAAGPLSLAVVPADMMAEPSWDMPAGTMLAVARRVGKALSDEGFDGVVVTHGLDAMESTSFLTSLLVTAPGGIVFTGARRYLDAPGSDGPRNLAVALTAAASRADGVAVCLDGTVQDVVRRQWPEPKGEPETDVALIRTYPGMPGSIVYTAVDAGARGVVLEGTGSGSIPVELFSTVSELSDWDIPVVVAATGPAGMSVGPELAERMGAISARGLTPVQARMALMVALGSGGVTAVRDWFARI